MGSVIVGNNSDLMEAVTSLWVADGETVLDVTYGEGSFWAFEPTRFSVRGHDRYKLDGVDFRSLPEASGSQEVLALDPPYRPKHGGTPKEEHANRYGLGDSDSPDTINDVTELYQAGAAEAFRVLKSGGRLFVKCQDLSYGHRLHLVTLDVLRHGIEAGFDFADQFILAHRSGARRGRQKRANRSHSVLWVLRKP